MHSTNAAVGNSYNAGLIQNNGAGGLAIENKWDGSGQIVEHSATSALTLLGYTDDGGGMRIVNSVAGGVINLQGATVQNGSLTTVAGSVVNVNAAASPNAINNENVYNNGAIDINATTLLAHGDFFNNGAINLVGAGADLELTGWVGLKGSGTLALQGNDAITSNGTAVTLQNVSDTIVGSGTIGNSKFQLDNNAHGTINANSASGALKIVAKDMDNEGLIESTAAGGLTINNTDAMFNGGTMLASAGTLDVSGPVNGFGVAEVSGTGCFEFGASTGTPASFYFLAGATGSLLLDHSQSYAPEAIYGFGKNMAVDLKDIAYVSGMTPSVALSSADAAVSVISGAHSAFLDFLGVYSAKGFSLSTDGHGGTLVKYA